MKKYFIGTILLLISSCTHGPVDNREFDDITNSQSFVGTFINLGETSEKIEEKIYLSKIIWLDDNEMKHNKIQYVSVSKINKNKLRADARQGDRIVKTRYFIKGVDFEIEDGRLDMGLKSHSDTKLLHFMFVVNSMSFGIDKNGDGKYRNTEYGVVAGLLTGFIPLPGIFNNDVRFRKIK